MSGRRGQGGLSAPLLGYAQFTPRGYLTKDESAGSGNEPVNRSPDVVGLVACGKGGAVDHQDRQAKGARGNQFGLCTAATGILGDHEFDAVLSDQCCVRGRVKRASVKDDVVVGQRWPCLWRIDKAQQVMVLGLLGKSGQMHAAKRQKDALWRPCQSGNRARNVGDIVPSVAPLCRPWGACEGHQGRARRLCCMQGIAADLGGKRVGRIDEMRDRMGAQIAGKPCRTAKTAHAHGHGLGFGALYPPGIAERGGKARSGERCDKARGLDRAAKDKDVMHG
ncbi:hypothetical protein LY56_02731 [Roseinatronobacter thiooxidans]|uniref:Uncharacterized protein n=1 Tax=Roseinatronobacter thiooxidans TaxID=121821 RepID=A0A2W7PTT8_9RHOB|nr:hypothetical protein LY56_02731 [Roseinatronobacter thiooxidans]